MITMQQWMELVNYRITEGSDYGWSCYGDKVYTLDSWNGVHDQGGRSTSIVFGTTTVDPQVVFEASVCDYTRNRAYRLINPEYLKAHEAEAAQRGVSAQEAWDGVDFVDLETVSDFMTKAQAIVSGQDYDERVEIVLELDDATAYQAMRQAHERDMTFNQYMVELLTQGIQELKKAAK